MIAANEWRRRVWIEVEYSDVGKFGIVGAMS